MFSYSTHTRAFWDRPNHENEVGPDDSYGTAMACILEVYELDSRPD